MKKIRPSRKIAFVVDRRKWFRGNGEADSTLLNQAGGRCCLGFVGSQCQIPDLALLRKPSPIMISKSQWPKWPKWFLGANANLGGNSKDCFRAMILNDDDDISDKMREYKLKRLFKKHGCSIRFTH